MSQWHTTSLRVYLVARSESQLAEPNVLLQSRPEAGYKLRVQQRITEADGGAAVYRGFVSVTVIQFGTSRLIIRHVLSFSITVAENGNNFIQAEAEPSQSRPRCNLQ